MTDIFDISLEYLILQGEYEEAEKIILKGEGRLDCISENAYEAFKDFIENT